MNLKSISLNVGKALLVNALFMFLSVIISVGYGFDEAFTPLLISFSVTFLTGAFPFIFVRKAIRMNLKEGYTTMVLAWMLSFLFGMLPYVLYGGEFTLVNAWFESVSGYTTTGSTILTDIESLPRSLLFWRSSTHFIGGLGTVAFLLLILSDASPVRFRLTSLEISELSRNGYKYKAGATVRVMLSVYVMLTLAETLLLWAAGMNLFDAVNHSFSTVSTGGFSTRNASVMSYDSRAIDLIILVFMVLSSMHFGVIFSVFTRGSLTPLKSSVTKYYGCVIAFLSLAVTLVMLLEGGYTSIGRAVLDSTFQVVSYLSTTGFGQADNAAWPVLANLILLYAAFHCGCSGSATGGIKADRMLVAIKEIRNEFNRRMRPSSVVKSRIDGVVLRNDAVSSVFLFIVTYVFVMVISFIVLLMCGVDVDVAFSGTLSSVGNVGHGIGRIGTIGNFNFLTSVPKIVFTMDMVLGRLEIFPVLVVISMLFHRGDK